MWLADEAELDRKSVAKPRPESRRNAGLALFFVELFFVIFRFFAGLIPFFIATIATVFSLSASEGLKAMFCSKCGLENQHVGVYCRQCGTMQPGPTSVVSPIASQELKKTRIAGVMTGGLALLSAVILILTLLNPDARYEGRLAFAAACSLLVAAYQAYTLYLGRNISEPRSATERDDAQPDDRIYTPPRPAIDQVSFNTADLPISSVTEHTTRTLDPVKRPNG